MAAMFERAKEVAKGAYKAAKEAVTGKPHASYKMLLIGETGSGKTSFLNLICNCGMIQALHVGFGDVDAFSQLRQFNAVELENAVSNQMESKTSGAKLYNVELCGIKMGVVDTPGFGDSRGIEEDKRNVAKIIDALKEEDYLNCVCLIINGRQSRMSATLRYVLTEITAILPKEIVSNVIVVFTNTADGLDLNFDLNALETFFGKEIENSRMFCIENPYCRLDKAKKQTGKLPAEKIVRSLQKSFDETNEVLKEMSTTVKDFHQVHTARFTTLYEKKQEIEAKVLSLLVAYDNQQDIEKKLAQAEAEAVSALHKRQLNKDFHSTQHMERWKVVATDRHYTLCGAAHCHSNCHAPCWLPKSFDKEYFKNCAAMGGSNTCKVCGHSYHLHYHAETRYEKEEYTEELVDYKMKKKFEEAKTMEERATIFKQKLKLKRQASQQERQRLSERLLSTLEEFHKLGINRNYAKLLENQLAVVECRLEGSVGPETQDLRKTKDEVEKKLKLVTATLNQPWSPNADVSVQRQWACKMLGLPCASTISCHEVERAYREMARSNHPDKSAGDSEYFKRVQRAKEILLQR